MGIENGNGNERGRNISEVAGKVVEKTQEPAFDVYIDTMLGHVPSISALEALNSPTTQEAQFIDRLDRIKEQLAAFMRQVEERFPEGRGYRAQIRDALRLMIKVHIQQGDRKDTQEPFIAHPLAVASDALRMMENADNHEALYVCVSALLHDAVEDRRDLLRLEKQTDFEQGERFPRKDQDQEDALAGLESIFDIRVRFLVDEVTTPLIKLGEDTPREEKNRIYMEYIERIFSHQDSSPAVIKWADLKQNALTIGLICERAEAARADGAVEEAAELEEFYQKVKDKYAPVLGYVLTFFEQLTFKEHPLFNERERAIDRLKKVLEEEYRA